MHRICIQPHSHAVLAHRKSRKRLTTTPWTHLLQAASCMIHFTLTYSSLTSISALSFSHSAWLCLSILACWWLTASLAAITSSLVWQTPYSNDRHHSFRIRLPENWDIGYQGAYIYHLFNKYMHLWLSGAFILNWPHYVNAMFLRSRI